MKYFFTPFVLLLFLLLAIASAFWTLVWEFNIYKTENEWNRSRPKLYPGGHWYKISDWSL